MYQLFVRATIPEWTEVFLDTVCVMLHMLSNSVSNLQSPGHFCPPPHMLVLVFLALL